MSTPKFSIIVTQDFTDFITKFGIGIQKQSGKEAVLRGNSVENSITCIKKLSSMKMSGVYTFKPDRVAELSLRSDSQFIIGDEPMGIIDSKKFSQILKLNDGEYWFLVKNLDDGVEKIFTVSKKKVAEIPLSTFMDDTLKVVDIKKSSMFNTELPQDMLSTLSKDCSAIEGQFFYIGFRSDGTDNLGVYIILGEKSWYRTETALDVIVDTETINKLKEGCGSRTYFKENSDGYDCVLRYTKDNLKDVISAINKDSIVNVVLNFKGGLVFNEVSETDISTTDVCYGILPVAV